MAWKIDSTHTFIEFSVKYMMITRVRGQFTSFDGTLKIDPEDPTASFVEGTVDTTSLHTKDPKRDGHLRSPDFFDVEKYPTMHFRSTRIESVGGERFKVVGDLTIKDVTKEVVFDVTNEGQAQDPMGNTHWVMNATTTLNRKDFDLTWNVALETGGWLVGDEVKVTIELGAVQEQEQEAAAAEAT